MEKARVRGATDYGDPDSRCSSLLRSSTARRCVILSLSKSELCEDRPMLCVGRDLSGASLRMTKGAGLHLIHRKRSPFSNRRRLYEGRGMRSKRRREKTNTSLIISPSVTCGDSGRNHRLLPALAKNMSPTCFFNASRPSQREPYGGGGCGRGDPSPTAVLDQRM